MTSTIEEKLMQKSISRTISEPVCLQAGLQSNFLRGTNE